MMTVAVLVSSTMDSSSVEMVMIQNSISGSKISSSIPLMEKQAVIPTPPPINMVADSTGSKSLSVWCQWDDVRVKKYIC